MKEIKVIFLGDAYTFPSDIQEFITILQRFDGFQSDLNQLLLNLMKKSDWKDGTDRGLSYFKTTMDNFANRLIQLLSKYGIYDITITDLVDNNPGFIKLREVCNNTLESMKRILSNAIDNWMQGYENAQTNAASKVTGMGFSVWTSSLSSALAYSVMEANTLSKQQKKAQQEFQTALNNLSKRNNDQRQRQENELLVNYFYPGVADSLEQFVTSMMAVFIAKINDYGIFDFNSVKNYNLKRSTELLNNLRLISDKVSLLKQAFVICPFNPDVYIAVAELGLMDISTANTAKFFYQDKVLLQSIQKKIPSITYPCNFNYEVDIILRYNKILAVLLNSTPELVIKNYTNNYYNSTLYKYHNLQQLITNTNKCSELLNSLETEELLSSNNDTMKNIAEENVKKIITDADFTALSKKCGYNNLLEELSPDDVIVNNKTELDDYYIQKISEKLISLLKEHKEIREKQKLEQEQKIREREERIKKYEHKKKVTRIIIATTVPVTICLVAILVSQVFIPLKKYNQANFFYQNKDYDRAISAFKDLDGFKDSQDKIKEITYQKALSLFDTNNYDEAIYMFENLKGYSDSDTKIKEVKYQKAMALLHDKKYEETESILQSICDYKDAQTQIDEIKYQKAMDLMNDKNYEEARKVFLTIENYKDSKIQIKTITETMEYNAQHSFDNLEAWKGKLNEYSIDNITFKMPSSFGEPIIQNDSSESYCFKPYNGIVTINVINVQIDFFNMDLTDTYIKSYDYAGFTITDYSVTKEGYFIFDAKNTTDDNSISFVKSITLNTNKRAIIVLIGSDSSFEIANSVFENFYNNISIK